MHYQTFSAIMKQDPLPNFRLIKQMQMLNVDSLKMDSNLLLSHKLEHTTRVKFPQRVATW